MRRIYLPDVAVGAANPNVRSFTLMALNRGSMSDPRHRHHAHADAPLPPVEVVAESADDVVDMLLECQHRDHLRMADLFDRLDDAGKGHIGPQDLQRCVRSTTLPVCLAALRGWVSFSAVVRARRIVCTRAAKLCRVCGRVVLGRRCTRLPSGVRTVGGCELVHDARPAHNGTWCRFLRRLGVDVPLDHGAMLVWCGRRGVHA